MSAKVRGLGHIGFYVQDLDLMKDFYANFMVMTLTKVGSIGASAPIPLLRRLYLALPWFLRHNPK